MSGTNARIFLACEKVLGLEKDPDAALIIRVARGLLGPAAKLSPLGIVVNRSNPRAAPGGGRIGADEAPIAPIACDLPSMVGCSPRGDFEG